MKRNIFYSLLLLLFSIILASCSSSVTTTPKPSATSSPDSESPATEATMSLTVTSDAFANGQSIPAKYSCVGKNISPALAWNEPPAGTQSFALIVDDPDAPVGTWVHWVLFNIPSNTRNLQEDLPITGKNVDPNAIYVGKNSSGNTRYDGPCPPSGTHRYYFKLYALDTTLSLLPGATKEQVLTEMKGHLLAQGELMGTFSK
ncbi:MAG TPA: YbhB/YbcL family Raf kinase inhibitor-like protein [Anaerolineales bacterium]|nr:YbhB/YbcL family Raf kinase inhibitor-like protein [Anaerolineales bacterium]